MTGLMAGGESDALAQYVLYNNSSVGHFSGFGFLWLLAIGLFFFMAAGKFMRMRAWQMAGRSESTDWRKEWRHGGPPWHRPCPDAEPDATTSDTPTSVADSALTSPAAAEVDTDSA